MRRPYLLVLLPLTLWLLISCSNEEKTNAQRELGPLAEPFRLELTLDTIPAAFDSIEVRWLTGGESKVLATAPIERRNKKAYASLKGYVPAPGVYVVSFSPRMNTSVVLGVDDVVEITFPNVVDPTLATVTRSEENRRFYEYIRGQRSRQTDFVALYNMPDPEIRRAAAAKIWEETKASHRSLAEGMRVLPVFFASQEIPPFGLGSETDQSDHFLSHYFDNDSLASPLLGYMSLWQFKAEDYAQLLLQANLTSEEIITRLDTLIARLPKGSMQLRIFLETIAAKLTYTRLVYAHLGEIYLQQFPEGAKTEDFQKAATQLEGLRPGNTAPDLELTTPQGKTLKLSSLRGKIVLIDFWAAWCKPCRAEVPNLKKLYQQYHAKGFEIYSISIDQTRDAWLQAVQEDKMTWPLVHDGQNTATQRYHIEAIPATILLDREGNILTWDLRGDALARSLQKLLGEA